MGVADWKTIYRAYDAEELATEMADLKKDLKGAFSSQSSGGTSHSREQSELRDRLNAATQVQRERSGSSRSRRGVVDFSGNDLSDF